MIFHEIYGNYYRAVARILALAVKGQLDKKALYRIVKETAFAESVLDIPAALQNGEWPLITADYGTNLKREPEMPLTLLEQRWLKTISLDPRFVLFGIPEEAIPDREPLFTPEDLLYYDRYADGDPYKDADYIRRFRLILAAIREEKVIRLTHFNRYGVLQERDGIPRGLEYSDRDDKFRLRLLCEDDLYLINLARVTSVRDSGKKLKCKEKAPRTETLLLELKDERNALERMLMQLSHYRKEAERISGNIYQISLIYDPADATELLIRVLSFGAVVRILSPETMVAEARRRILRQADLFSSGKNKFATFFP